MIGIIISSPITDNNWKTKRNTWKNNDSERGSISWVLWVDEIIPKKDRIGITIIKVNVNKINNKTKRWDGFLKLKSMKKG
jgi:hypothetical protein